MAPGPRGTPTTLYSIWTYDNDRNLKYLTSPPTYE